MQADRITITVVSNALSDVSIMSKPAVPVGPTANAPGRNTTPGSRGRRPDQRQRGNFAVGPVVRIAVDHVLQSFRALPVWGQREAATALTGLYPNLFGSEPVANASGASRRKSAGLTPSGATGKSLTQDAIPSSDGPGKAAKPTREIQPKVVGNPATRKERKPKGFQRPEVSDLEFSIRLKDHPEGYTREMRAVDESLLSSALAAVSRGEAAGQSSEEIRTAISMVRASKSSYERLWPSQRVRRAYAEKRACEVDSLREPRIWSVEDHLLILTPHRPLVEMEDDTGGKPIKYKLDPCDIPFHSSSEPALDVSKESVQLLISGVKGNYARFDKSLWSLNNRITLLWVKDYLVSLSWADEEDNEVVLPVTPAKSPRLKKRKLDSKAP